MTPYTIVYHSNTHKFFKKSPPRLSVRILDRIKQVASDPLSPDTNLTKLKEPLDGYRLRVGDYRIIYLLDHSTRRLIVVKIDHRSAIYN